MSNGYKLSVLHFLFSIVVSAFIFFVVGDTESSSHRLNFPQTFLVALIPISIFLLPSLLLNVLVVPHFLNKMFYKRKVTILWSLLSLSLMIMVAILVRNTLVIPIPEPSINSHPEFHGELLYEQALWSTFPAAVISSIICSFFYKRRLQTGYALHVE